MALVVVLALVVVMECSPGLREALGSWNRLHAELFGLALAATGLSVTVSDATIIDPGGFRVVIVYGCTGFVPGLIVIAWVASLRQRTALKLLGLAGGLLLVIVVNLVRVLATFHVGVACPEYLPIVHEVVGHGVVLLSTIVFLIYWHRLGSKAIPASATT